MSRESLDRPPSQGGRLPCYLFGALFLWLLSMAGAPAWAGGSLGALPPDQSRASGAATARPVEQRVAGGPILIWRTVLSDVQIPSCRFVPSCSRYGEEAVSRFGFWLGWPMAMDRYLRCHGGLGEGDYAVSGPFYIDRVPSTW